MNRDSLISVIIPVYNCERYLEECLDSVVNQTYSNMEIILVDDGSMDTSAEICQRYAKADDRIVYIRQDNRGSAAARNHGIRVARGDLLMFLDSDDLLDRDACKYVNQEMQEHDLLILDYQVFHEASQICEAQSGAAPVKTDLCCYGAEDWTRSLLGAHRIVPECLNLNAVWAKAYRRQFVEKHGIGFPTDVMIGEDVLFNLRTYLHHPKVCSLSVKSYFYRYNTGSVAHRYKPGYQHRDRRYLEALEEILEQENLLDAMREELEYQKANGHLLILSGDTFHRNNPKTVKEKRAEFYALVENAEYRNILLKQRMHFPPVKRLVLYFSAKKRYWPVCMMYWIHNMLKRK